MGLLKEIIKINQLIGKWGEKALLFYFITYHPIGLLAAFS